jgi:hypothetical protein
MWGGKRVTIAGKRALTGAFHEDLQREGAGHGGRDEDGGAVWRELGDDRGEEGSGVDGG